MSLDKFRTGKFKIYGNKPRPIAGISSPVLSLNFHKVCSREELADMM
jgi:hypothetical protein